MSAILRLFWTFLKIGLFSIGGGYAIIPLIREQVVANSGWISSKMFTDIITISQMTPGPLAVNTSTFVGLQVGGIAGAVAATVGCVLCGIVICLLLHRFFQRHQSSIYVFEVLNGLKSASLGLIVSAAATIVLTALWGAQSVPISDAFSLLNGTALAIFSVALLVLRRWKPNPMLVMLASGVAGLLLYS
ncbi:chromate transporter [bacterium 210820-DFI.6.52]|nr:chromate transporter [bacterium 210820-DFI.6.52]